MLQLDHHSRRNIAKLQCHHARKPQNGQNTPRKLFGRHCFLGLASCPALGSLLFVVWSIFCFGADFGASALAVVAPVVASVVCPMTTDEVTFSAARSNTFRRACS